MSAPCPLTPGGQNKYMLHEVDTKIEVKKKRGWNAHYKWKMCYLVSSNFALDDFQSFFLPRFRIIVNEVVQCWLQKLAPKTMLAFLTYSVIPISRTSKGNENKLVFEKSRVREIWIPLYLYLFSVRQSDRVEFYHKDDTLSSHLFIGYTLTDGISRSCYNLENNK